MPRRRLRLVGTQEIRQLLGGVSKTRAAQITGRRDFPEPVAVLAAGKIWLADDVEAWIREHRPTLTDDEPE